MCASVLAVLVLVATACGGSERPSRPETLSAIAAEVIVPGYEEAATESGDLAQAARRLCASPDESRLAEARHALADARRAWKSTEAFWVGPVMDRRSWALVDWPVNEDEVRKLIDDESGPTIDAAYVARFVGADQRGLGTAELLLGGGLESLGGRACDYLRSTAEVAAGEIEEVLALWNTSETVDDFVEDGVDDLVNDAIFLTRRVSDMELGPALGVADRNADLERIVEGPLGLGVKDGLARLSGLRAVFVGVDGSGGLSSLLDDELAERLGSELAATEATWEVVPTPLRAAVTAQPDLVEQARDAIVNLERVIATDVVSQLGVAVGFSDLDGDSGG